MLSSAAKFADDAAGLEKTLRLVQGFCTAVVGLALSVENVAPWRQARSQLALGRRYFRLLKWHSCWNVAYERLHDNEDPLPKLLGVCNWSFLGLYYFLEMPTITNAMGVTSFAWGPRLQGEADKCWFYAISFSICLSLYRLLQLFFAQTASSATNADTSKSAQAEKSKQAIKPTSVQRSTHAALLTQLTIDCCDLTIPGFSTGWIPVQLTFVGAAQFTSSALAILHIWSRVQMVA